MKASKQIDENFDAIDRNLAGEELLVPSSGFLAAVMERVRDEAIAPRPIPFPWKRALPGMVLAAGAIGWVVYEFIRYVAAGGFAGVGSVSSVTIHLPAATQQTLGPVMWIGLAFAVSLASWGLARRMARGARLF